MITTQQIQRIHALLPTKIRQDKEQKAQLMAQYTGNPKRSSTKDLSYLQAQDLITTLGGQNVENWALFNKTSTQQMNVLSICIQLGWSSYSLEYGRYLADLNRLSNWLKSSRSPVQKRLKKMSRAELTKIISALEIMLNKHLNK